MTQRIEGKTPIGAKFTLVNKWHGTRLVARSLHFDAFQDVGPIIIPLHIVGPAGDAYSELCRLGYVTPKTRKAVFAT